MTYIWINPVTTSMYEPNVLRNFLKRHGYEQFETATDWLSIVREKYVRVVRDASSPVADVRCPKIRPLLEELQVASDVTFPDIAPILIHCGQEASNRVELKNAGKVITTPCQALADMGNALRLEDTYFIPWNDFLMKVGEEPQGTLPKESPIPPGFFEGLGLKTASITGEDEIRSFFKEGVPKDVQLIELLFCKGGCHNGDGIRR